MDTSYHVAPSGAFFVAFITISAVTALLSNGTEEFAEAYIQQALSPIAENLAYDGEEFTFQNNPLRIGCTIT